MSSTRSIARKPARRKPRKVTTARGLDPAVFMEAARLIETEQQTYGCHALQRAARLNNDDETPETVYFADVLQPPEPRQYSGAWYINPVEGIGPDEDTGELTQSARAMGLCLCALLIVEGFDPKEG